MPEQKFHVGDIVRIRPFDEIDDGDIGDLKRTSTECYAIHRSNIDGFSKSGPCVVKSGREIHGTYIYRLEYCDSGRDVSYYWAQGMLYSDSIDELPESDYSGLFSFLFG